MLQITGKSCAYIQVKLTTSKIQGSDRILFYIFILALFISFLTGNMMALDDSKLSVIPLLQTTSVTGSPGYCGCLPCPPVFLHKLCPASQSWSWVRRTTSFGKDIVVHPALFYAFENTKKKGVFHSWTYCGWQACFPPQVVFCLLKLIPGQEDKTISFGKDTVVHLALFYAFEE